MTQTLNSAKRLTLVISTACLLLSGLLASGLAQAVTAPKSIEKAVQRHVDRLLKQHQLANRTGQRIEFSVSKIDPNLRMASCSSPLRLQKNDDRMLGRVSIKVRCEGTRPWQIYVPVTIKAYQKVVTAAVPLARDQRLDRVVLELKEKEVSRLTQGYFSNLDQVIGKTVKRPLQVNGVLLPNMIIETMVISRGDEVMIVAKSGALSVKSPGIAINKGRIGQQIQVKNKASKRVVTARIINSKLVQVVM